MKTLAQPGDKAEILHRLTRVRPESVRLWGRMTAHQTICHLADSFRMALGRKAVKRGAVPIPRAVLRWIVLYLPLRWPAGRILTSPELDQEVGGTPPGDFAADVADLASLLDLVTAQARDFEWQEHPLFGRMPAAAWLRWGYLHMDHHLRQFGA